MIGRRRRGARSALVAGRPRAALLLAAGLLLGGAAAPESAREYQIKAAFLFNFARFVEWPETAFASADAPLCIGVLGRDPFDGALDELVRGQRVRGRPLAVRRSRRADDFRDCHLLFVSRSEGERLDEILASVAAAPVLTVGETAGFARRGGVINFRLVDGRVRFEINPRAARREGLRLSSQLLSVGTLVDPEG